jgi:hypothetical protein
MIELIVSAGETPPMTVLAISVPGLRRGTWRVISIEPDGDVRSYTDSPRAEGIIIAAEKLSVASVKAYVRKAILP